MKNLSVLLLMLIAHHAFSQLELPGWSSDVTMRQKIGFTNFELRYGRPSVRGRKIFDGLVRYGKLWRTGANKATTISFDKDVTIGGKNVSAGIYSLATIPGIKEWTVVFNTDTSKVYGDPSEYDVKTEALRFTVTPKKSGRFYETFTIDLEQKKGDAVLVLLWENTEISFDIVTNAHQLAMRSIDAELQRHPDDYETKLTAAWYYYMNGEDAGKALKWVDESLEKEETWWGHELRSDLLIRLGKTDEAKTAIENGIAFLQRTKRDGWEKGVLEFQVKIKNLRQSKAR